MNDIGPIYHRSCEWIRLSNEDFDSARYMFDGNRYTYVYFLCQQAVEKAIKAVVEYIMLPPKNHNLLKLAQLSGINIQGNEENLCMVLYRNYTRLRYPDMKRFIPDRMETESVLKETGELLCRIKTKVML